VIGVEVGGVVKRWRNGSTDRVGQNNGRDDMGIALPSVLKKYLSHRTGGSWMVSFRIGTGDLRFRRT
jgi:hypothetical protein